MKKIGILLILFLQFACQKTDTQKEQTQITTENEICTDLFVDEKVCHDEHYNVAYNEMKRMLDGKQKKDFKRAVFLLEWAYSRGTLDYGKFCTDIDEIVRRLRDF